MGYAQAKKDFLFLETIAELNDQVTLMDELQNFMASPTRAFAANLYEQAIDLWFNEHGTEGHGRRAANIADRYFIT
jgi:hypothetical protein